MANSLYVTGLEPSSGKVLVSLGVASMLERTGQRIGFFRPVGRPERLPGRKEEVIDRHVALMRERFDLPCDPADMVGVTIEEAETMVAAGEQARLAETVLDSFKRLQERVDFVLCEGTDYRGATASVELELNIDLARDLGCPVALVVDGSSGDPSSIHSRAMVGIDGFRAKGCEVIAVVVNKIVGQPFEAVAGQVTRRLSSANVPVVVPIPYEAALAMPSMAEVAAHLGGGVLYGHDYLHNKVGKIIVASGSVETMIPLLADNVLLVTHLDRHDAILMAMLSLLSHSTPNIAGMVLSGEQELAQAVQGLLAGLPGPQIPIVRSPKLTYETTLALTQLRASLGPGNDRDLEIARQLFELHVDPDALRGAIHVSRPAAVTPKMFKYELIKRARGNKQRIVLPEGDEPRILRAADALLRLKAAELVLLGDPPAIRTLAGQLGVDVAGAEIVDPRASEWAEQFAVLYQQARASKGMTLEAAREAIVDPPLFGTLMVETGRADGMVAGARTSTAATIRPAFQVIKTRPACSLVSSVFFMCLEDRVLVYGDCAVNPDPTAQQLAEIAVTSAETARAFGIEPVVAMLSYSTGSSGQGADVDKVREAVRIAGELRPDLLLEGPLQYDAAVDATVAKTKLPESRVGGHATVFIFPDLNTGNNTYKAVQRSAHAVAIGPVLQGLNKPVNDLSRGCTVEDVINTVAITAIQAQAKS